MSDPFQQALEEEYLESPEGQENPFSDPFEQAAADPAFKEDMDEEQEGFWKSSLRSAMQPIQGFLETTGPGLAASFWQLLAAGELDHEEMDRLKQVYEREGKEFPEEEFEEAREKAMSMIPTVRNLASAIEERTGFPLEPKTRFQKGVRFLTEAARLSPSGAILRPLNVGLPKPVLGAGVEATREVLKEIGVPEPFDELLAFGILKQPPKGAPRLEIGAKKKPSGLTERGFESLEEGRKVSEKKFGKINNALESDFKNIADDIIKTSPIGKTHAELAENPLFKTEVQEQFKKVQELADQIPEQIDSMLVKKAIAEQAQKKITTKLAPSEYTKEYHKFMKQFIEETPSGTAGAGDLVRSYRTNNQDLSGAYDPVKSKNFNRAKKDAILDYNRALSNVIQKEFPNTEFSKLFPETNKTWSQIIDAEKINESINEMFKGKLNHNQIREFFDNPHTNAPFRRALGENYPKFEQLMKDLLTTEKPYKMLQVAKQKGLSDFVETASLFVISPKLSMGKKALDYAKHGARFILNTVLDKPKLTIKWHDGIKNLKKGDFKAAEKDFAFLKSQVEETKKQAVRPSEILDKEGALGKVEPETLEAKVEKIKPEPSTLEKTQSRIEELKKTQPPAESKRSEPERKRLEHKPKENIEDLKVETERELSRSRHSYIKSIETKDGKFVSEITYDKEPDGNIFLSFIQTDPEFKRTGAATKLLKNLIEENPTSQITLSALQPDGAKLFSKLLEKDLKPTLGQDYEKIGKIKPEPVSLNQKDMNVLKKNLGIEHKSIDKPKITKAEKKAKIDKEAKATKVKEAKEKKKAEIKTKTDTPKKVEQKIEHAAERPDITKKGLQTQKAFILDRLEDAIKNPSKFGEKIDIDVPGDGKFKIHNNEKALEQFKETVKKKWPEKTLPNQQETYTRKKLPKEQSKEQIQKKAQVIHDKRNKLKSEFIERYKKTIGKNHIGKSLEEMMKEFRKSGYRGKIDKIYQEIDELGELLTHFEEMYKNAKS